MSIEHLITEPVTERTETVRYRGTNYTLRGRPDANLIGRTQGLTEDQRQLQARHLSKLAGGEIDPEMVPQILLVSATLVREEDGGPDRYDPSQVAALALRHGGFFLRLVEAALTVTGMRDEDLIDEVTMGNSSASAESSGS